ncbi:hypothetical protein GOP47_0000899 [Adiantum capillus-veneris]|uniref:Uncharacterized protein n=1 Tax=Adiantum capillus-veneris TaxID=13818 RepID=A0A9D4ZTH5_ADICA|nr:hypothetical protein GOP47_0000899 [Adiantum capillus-veneris]
MGFPCRSRAQTGFTGPGRSRASRADHRAQMGFTGRPHGCRKATQDHAGQGLARTLSPNEVPGYGGRRFCVTRPPEVLLFRYRPCLILAVLALVYQRGSSHLERHIIYVTNCKITLDR